MGPLRSEESPASTGDSFHIALQEAAVCDARQEIREGFPIREICYDEHSAVSTQHSAFRQQTPVHTQAKIILKRQVSKVKLILSAKC
jgi:hypothetical protein